jgi:hypothetical protein
MKILIIPDVHGRQFWTRAKELVDSVDKIIFLGDYVDPYGFEGVSQDDAIQTLKEIIAFAKEYNDKVVLLFGNHCLHYVHDIFKAEASGGRIDKKNYLHIKQIYFNNLDLFKLAYEIKDNDKRYLFSHAGVCKAWYEKYEDLIGELNAVNLNKLLDSDDGMRSLCDVGYSRWGNSKVGSIVWADVDDHKIEPLENIYQIFGHTQQAENEQINENYACLDVRKCFLLDNNVFKRLE